MAKRDTKRAWRAAPGLLILLCQASSTGAMPLPKPKVMGNSKMQRQMLAKELMLASNACRKADLRLDQNIEALAKSLPVLLPLDAAYFGDDFSAADAQQLRLKLSRYLGPNPYDQAEELKGELQRARGQYKSMHAGQDSEQSRVYLLRAAQLDWQRPEAAIEASLPYIERNDTTPGTIYILTGPNNRFCVLGLSIDGHPLKSEQGYRAALGHFRR